MSRDHLVLAAYKLLPLEDPEDEVIRHQEFFLGRGTRGRIYIDATGLNVQMSGPVVDVQEYMTWLSRYGEWQFKLSSHHENVFPRMAVKHRPLVAMGAAVDLTQGGEHVSSSRWREMLESGEALLVDVRNDYEWDLGHFRGSKRPECETFRDFTKFTRRLKDERGVERPIMMCCTGGIRCEFCSAFMKHEGFEKVYQLDGGILRYAEEEAGKHWEGKLFVFDDRLSVEVNAEEPTVVGRCHACDTPSDEYFNCANMDCNHLFLSCKECLLSTKGCCCPDCQMGERVRPLAHLGQKPFRKWHSTIGQNERARH